MTTPPFKVRELGEVAIRCADLDRMMSFYRDIIGLEVFADTRDDGIVFFKLGDGFGGHTTVLALFKPDAGPVELHDHSQDKPITGARSSLHHLALTVAFEEQDAAMKWFDENEISYRVQVFDWVGWRGIFTKDPEGNTVELVAAHPSLKAR